MQSDETCAIDVKPRRLSPTRSCHLGWRFHVLVLRPSDGRRHCRRCHCKYSDRQHTCSQEDSELRRQHAVGRKLCGTLNPVPSSLSEKIVPLRPAPPPLVVPYWTSSDGNKGATGTAHRLASIRRIWRNSF